MLLSRACEYAIKACIYIASLAPGDGRANAEEISNSIKAPRAFTAKILKQLGKADLLSSVKGPGGGFFMTEVQKRRPLTDIIETVDGSRLFTQCALGLSECSENQPCPLHDEYGPIREKITRMMRLNSIEDLARSYGSGQAFLATIDMGG